MENMEKIRMLLSVALDEFDAYDKKIEDDKERAWKAGTDRERKTILDLVKTANKIAARLRS